MSAHPEPTHPTPPAAAIDQSRKPAPAAPLHSTVTMPFPILRAARRHVWQPLLLSLFSNALLPLTAHEATRHAFEHSLDPRETRSLALARSLTNGLGARSTLANSDCQLALTVSDPNGQPRPAIIRIKNERGEALELPG